MNTPYVARGPEDLIALAPTVLRFDPEESVVVMTFGQPGRSFHARADLRASDREQDDVTATILKALRSNHLRECAVLIYSDDYAVAERQGRALRRALKKARIRLVDVLLVKGDRYFRLLQNDREGTEFDVSSHPFTAQRVLSGVVVHESREALAETLEPQAGTECQRLEIRCATERRLEEPADPVAERRWLQSALGAALASRSWPEEVAPRVLVGLSDPDLVDLIWAQIDRANAPGHVELWRDLVRSAPANFAAAPCALLAFSAWMAGDGALAWCAIDRCGAQPPPMARFLSQLLTAAVPPSAWPDVSADDLSSLRGPAA